MKGFSAKAIAVILSLAVLVIPLPAQDYALDYMISSQGGGASASQDYQAHDRLQFTGAEAGVQASQDYAVGDVFAAATAQADDTWYELQEVGHLEGVGNCRTLALSGDLAYLGTADQGLKIVDISEPSQPTVLHTEPVVGIVSDTYTSGSLVLFTSNQSSPRQGWFYILDASDPSDPTLLTQYRTRDMACGLDVRDNVAFIGDDDDGLTILDISNLSSPVQLDTYHIWNLQRIRINSNGTVAAVSESSTTDPRIHLFDISNPSSVSVITAIDNTGLYDVHYVDDTAYIAATPNGVLIYDLSTPGSPALLGSIVTDYCRGVAMDGSILYVADDHAGLKAFDVSDLESISLEVSIDTPGRTWNVEVTDSNLIAIADGTNGLVLFQYVLVPVELSFIVLE